MAVLLNNSLVTLKDFMRTLSRVPKESVVGVVLNNSLVTLKEFMRTLSRVPIVGVAFGLSGDTPSTEG